MLTTLGRAPEDAAGRARWRHAVRIIEQHRTLHDITHPDLPLGDPPADPDQPRDHARVLRQLGRVTREHERDRAPVLGISHGLSR